MIVTLSSGESVTTLAQLRSERDRRAYHDDPVERLWMLAPEHPIRVRQQKAFDAADRLYEEAKSELSSVLTGLTLSDLRAYLAAAGFVSVETTKGAMVKDYITND